MVAAEMSAWALDPASTAAVSAWSCAPMKLWRAVPSPPADIRVRVSSCSRTDSVARRSLADCAAVAAAALVAAEEEARRERDQKPRIIGETPLGDRHEAIEHGRQTTAAAASSGDRTLDPPA